MKHIREGAVKVGDILWTGGRQYFYVHNSANGRMVMSGVDIGGVVFSKQSNYRASYLMETQEERNKFFDLIEKYNHRFDKNRGVRR